MNNDWKAFSIFRNSDLDLDATDPKCNTNLSLIQRYLYAKLHCCISILHEIIDRKPLTPNANEIIKQKKKQFGRSKTGNYSWKIKFRVMVFALHGPLMVLSKCVLFQSSTFYTLGETVNYYIYLN